MGICETEGHRSVAPVNHGRSSDGPGFDGSPRNRRQGEARAVDLPARSIDPVALVVAPPLDLAS
jgi:hypothetical protein